MSDQTSSDTSEPENSSSTERAPGPYIIPIDYDALYAMEQPPEYEPFDVYGIFLLSVATQQTPMVVNPWKAIPDGVKKTADVVYKEVNGQQLSLDVYQPKEAKAPTPLIVVIHGGYWKTGDKAVHVNNEIEFAELGYAVAAMNYRLSVEHKFPAGPEDVFDSIKFLSDHASEFNIDPERIVVYGGSAGGHLSAFVGLAANTSGKSYNAGVNADAIKGIISLYGMHDLTSPIQREHPFTEQFIGKSYEEDPDAYQEASPISHVDENDPPVLLIHGSLDGSVSVRNSDALATRLQEAGVPHTFDRVEGWSHGMDLFSPIGERTLWHCYQFLKSYMPSDKLMSDK